MADLNVNTSDTTYTSEDVGQNLVINGDFENVPSFTAATTTAARWIDGTAGGSTTTDTYKWATITVPATSAMQFDNVTSHSGANSMQINKTAGVASTTNVAQVAVGNLSSVTAANQLKYGIPIYANTLYSVSVYYKQTSKTGGTNIVSANQYDGSSSTRLAAPNVISDASTIDKDWTLASGTFTSNASAKFLIMSVGVSSHLLGTVWYDDLYVQAVTPNGTMNILVAPVVTPGIQNISGPKIWS